jgi:hypothetical protein
LLYCRISALMKAVKTHTSASVISKILPGLYVQNPLKRCLKHGRGDDQGTDGTIIRDRGSKCK